MMILQLDENGDIQDRYRSYIHKSRYARWLPDKQRRETWVETVSRYCDYWKEKGMLNDDSYPEVYNAIINHEVMPSMRALMTAGTALDRDNVAGFNCSYVAINRQRAFDEIMYVLMCGTGVGFSCERQEVSQLPTVAESMHDTDTTIIVSDSKIGWASAFRELISLLYSGKVPKWDMSKIRSAGQPLKTFGGRASGPEPLDDLFKYSVNLFRNSVGRKLNSIEVHGLVCKIAEIVVVGGVRRSALISLSNLSDDRMRHAKSGQWWEQHPEFALANNSACYTEKPDAETFLREWVSLVESKSGERGIYNREASKRQAIKNGRRDGNWEFGTNPCCFTGDMRLLTSSGYESFEKLAGRKEISIINNDGEVSKGSVWCSGEKPVVEVRFSNRDSITCTDDHIFMDNKGKEVAAGKLQGKRVMPFFEVKKKFNYRPFMAGFIQGDGNTCRLNSPSHKGLEVYFGEKDQDIAKMACTSIGTWYSREALDIAKDFNLHAAPLPERYIVDMSTVDDDFFSGLYSANGSVINHHRVALKTTNKILAEQVKDWLAGKGITAYITTNKAKTVKFNNGDYTCKQSYDVNISKLDGLIKFAEIVSFGQKYKQEALATLIKEKAWRVVSVKPIGVEKIYDFTEPKNHWGVVEGVVVHNSEIILRDRQFCNLSEVVVRGEDTVDDLRRKVKVAAILGTLQATLTNFRYLSRAWKQNTEEEALLGVSLTGIMDHPILSGSQGGEQGVPSAKQLLPQLLEELKEVAVETNREWAERLGINQSTAITCVKPSGTVSQLTDAASGIHPRYSPFYIRTVRADKKDPLAQLMVESGFPVEDDVMKPDSTYVFSFPIKGEGDAVYRNDRSAIEQLEHWLTYQRYWCEHKPSVTIYVKDEEWPEVAGWVYKHFDEMSGVSFLPHSDHSYRQAPYQEITEEEYEEWVKRMPTDFTWLALSNFESSDMTEGVQQLACVAGVCDI